MAISTIPTSGIADNAVTAAKIPAGAVVADVGTDGITATQIAANAVGSSEIAADAVGSSELANDAVLPANIAYLGDGTGKLSGTITGQQLRLGTAFTLTDDLTVNGDLTLSKVIADGTGQSLTQDSSANRTLTGTGTLRMGHATEKTSIGAFTGTIDNSVTFPAFVATNYEEGTFTVTMSSGTVASEKGNYIRIGNMCQFSIQANNFASGTAGAAFTLYGLPFTSIAGAEWMATCMVSGVESRNGGAYLRVTGFLFENWDAVRIYESGVDSGESSLMYAQFDTGSQVRVTGTYQIA